jgi:hypothetical protein
MHFYYELRIFVYVHEQLPKENIVFSQNVKINTLNGKINIFYFNPRQRGGGSPNGPQGAEH